MLVIYKSFPASESSVLTFSVEGIEVELSDAFLEAAATKSELWKS
jgi:hypothetical protein